MSRAYLPFRGYSAWFSSSVHPSVVRKWDQYGGTLEPEGEAQLLFSDDAFAKDTIRVYSEQEVLVFLSSWVTEVVQSRSEALNVPLGKFCLQPHFRIQKSGDPFATPENAPITNLWKGTHSKDPRCENETQYRPRWLNSRLLPGGTEHSNQSPRTGSSVEQGQDTQQGENSHGWLEDSSGHVCAYSTSDPGTDLLIECGALWEPAVGTMATTQLQDIPHVQDLPTMTLPLYDFLPQLPQFTMTRRKN